MSNYQPEDLSPRAVLSRVNGHDGPHPLRVADIVQPAGDNSTVVHHEFEAAGWMARILRRNKREGDGPVHHHIGGGTKSKGEKVRGAMPINVATGLLFVLIGALFVVSWWAQYKFVFDVKHQDAASIIEASTLDGGQLIFSLLALGLSRRGLPATRTRFMIMFCALASAAMNYYAGAATSVRSTLVYVLPPIFLAMVVDEVIVVIRRHYLGDEIDSSWTAAGHLTVRVLRFSGLTFLYCLRVCLDPPGTVKGVRLLVLQATPLPEPPVNPRKPVNPNPRKPKAVNPNPERPEIEAPKGKRPSPKTDAFLQAVIKEHGPLHLIEGSTHQIALAMAGDYLHPYTASRVLREAVAAAKGEAK